MMFEFEMRGMRVFHILTSVLTICCFFLITLPQSRCQTHDAVCNEQPYKCGTLSNISYPFWGQNRSRQCGFSDQFELTCHDDDTTTSIRIGSQNFTVKELNTSAETMRLVRKDLADDVCSPQFGDTYDVNSSTVFRYSSWVYNITIFYNCSSSYTPAGFGNLTCGDEKGLFSNGAQDEVLKRFAWLERCGRHVRVPIDAPYDDKDGRQFLQQAFGSGFPVNYTLHTSNRTSPEVHTSPIISLLVGHEEMS